jgi:hypothetical protein
VIDDRQQVVIDEPLSADLQRGRLAGHGCWQTGGVEPVAEVPAAGRGGRPGQLGRYGIDGGFAGLAVFGVVEAGLAGTVAWAVRHRRPAVDPESR